MMMSKNHPLDLREDISRLSRMKMRRSKVTKDPLVRSARSFMRECWTPELLPSKPMMSGITSDQSCTTPKIRRMRSHTSKETTKGTAETP